MIDLKEKPTRRSSKRKFDESPGRTQPKETLLDMSVSKLAKAQTRVNLEPSLRKTVMIVNTIRKLEQEIESGKTKPVNEAYSVGYCSAKTNNYSNTRPDSATVYPTFGAKNSTDIAQKRLDLPLDTRAESFVCVNDSQTLFDRCPNIGSVLAKSCGSDDTFVEIETSTEMKFKNSFTGNCSSSCFPTMEFPADSEINFAEIDISLYDFDPSIAWSEGNVPSPVSPEDNDNVCKPCPTFSTFSKRCSDDIKLRKTAETTFMDDLDQVLQVLVGI